MQAQPSVLTFTCFNMVKIQKIIWICMCPRLARENDHNTIGNKWIEPEMLNKTYAIHKHTAYHSV